MEKKHQINVTNVVNKVKEQNLLFYPVIIHIFIKAFHNCGLTNINPAYINANDCGEISILSQEYADSFEVFFKNYIENCFYNQSSYNQSENMVLFSYVAKEQLNQVNKDTPTIYIQPLKQQDNVFYLSFLSTNCSVDEAFISACQGFCDLF